VNALPRTSESSLVVTTSRRPVFDLAPRLAAAVPFVPLADLPTPIVRLASLERALGAGGELFQKCDDRTSSVYGGNKVRTLEVLLGGALRREATHVYATGAFGSNHATATALHAPRVGLSPGAILYPQPESASSRDNLRVVLSHAGPNVRTLPHWSALPLGVFMEARAAKARGERAVIMWPGGATPLGALGYVSAGLELAEQVARGELPRPARVVVPVGSNCTTAGLLVGLALATQRGLGFTAGGLPRPPRVVAVRVTPWPITTRGRIVGLAQRTSELLAELAADASLAVEARALHAMLELEPRELGPGYGYGTRRGREAVDLWRAHEGSPLELTYSAKAAAAALGRMRERAQGPTLYWATKSSAPLPLTSVNHAPGAHPRVTRWLERAAAAEQGS